MIFPKPLQSSLIHRIFRTAETLQAYRQKPFQTYYKADQSPYTDADLAAHEEIAAALHALTPHIPLISEEGDITTPTSSTFWLLDPLDGTQNFIEGSDSYCINLALIHDTEPVIGLLCHPPSATLYATFGDHQIWRYLASAMDTPELLPAPQFIAPSAVLSSRNNDPSMIHRLLHQQTMPKTAVGSARKFIYLLEGKASHYPCAGSIMEWDIAAGDALLRAHGGGITTLEGQPMRYKKPGFINPHFLAVAGGVS